MSSVGKLQGLLRLCTESTAACTALLQSNHSELPELVTKYLLQLPHPPREKDRDRQVSRGPTPSTVVNAV